MDKSLLRWVLVYKTHFWALSLTLFVILMTAIIKQKAKGSEDTTCCPLSSQRWPSFWQLEINHCLSFSKLVFWKICWQRSFGCIAKTLLLSLPSTSRTGVTWVWSLGPQLLFVLEEGDWISPCFALKRRQRDWGCFKSHHVITKHPSLWLLSQGMQWCHPAHYFLFLKQVTSGVTYWQLVNISDKM